MNLKSSLIAAAALFACSFGASAYTIDLGVNPLDFNQDISVVAGSLDDKFFFEFKDLSSGDTASAGSYTKSKLGSNLKFDIANFTVALYQVDNLTALASDSSPKSAGVEVLGLSNGKYYFHVTGNVTGSDLSNRVYNMDASFAATTAPVPEPQSYALMLAGLAGMGFLLRRRQSV